MATTTDPAPQKPTVGRIVHFHASPEAPAEAAIVIDAPSDISLTLQKCNANGTWTTEREVFIEGSVQSGSTKFWRWPPRA